MATVILYPNSDVSVGHSKYPSNSNGYACINDTTADDDSSYLYDETSGSSPSSSTSSNKESTFGVSTSSVSRKIYLQSIQYRARHQKTNSNVSTSTLQVSCSVNGGSYSSAASSNSTTSYANYSGTLSPSGLNTVYNSFDAANIRVRLNSNITVTGKNDYGIRITQVYLTATYLPIYNCSAFAKSGTGISNVSISASEVKEGDTCTFTATVANNAVFDGWYSDEQCTNKVSSNTTYTATVNSDLTLYAKGFMVYTVSAQADENSTVSISPSSGPYKQGDTITVTATPSSSRYSFVAWYSNPERTTGQSGSISRTPRLPRPRTAFCLGCATTSTRTLAR